MNYIKHLTGFFERIIQDRSLNPTHVSLYIALFQSWNINRFQNPISITRDEVMRICKISSKATYHKCMRDLNEKGYVKYEPSYNPYKGSLIFLFDFSDYLKPVQKKASSPEKILSKSELVVNKQGTSNETSTGTSNEQALVSSINNTNITNNSNVENLGEQSQNVIARNEAISDDFLKNDAVEEKEKSSAKKEKAQTIADEDKNQMEINRPKEFIVTSSTLQNPTNDLVKAYFLEQSFPEREANKFFNYFSSVGWLVGGKTPMVDWKAAANNWMLNAPSFISHEKTPDRAKHLNTGIDKDYAEPF